MVRAGTALLILSLSFLISCGNVSGIAGGTEDSSVGSGQAQGDGTLGSQPVSNDILPCDKPEGCEIDPDEAGILDLSDERPFGVLMAGGRPFECGDEALVIWPTGAEDGNIQGQITEIGPTNPPMEAPHTLLFVDYGPVFDVASMCSVIGFHAVVSMDFGRGIPFQIVQTDARGGFSFPLAHDEDTMIGLYVLKTDAEAESGFFTDPSEYFGVLVDSYGVGNFRAQRESAAR